ncbi:MAG: prenyltransferase/squalene oxidase repeat-containing protein [Planctomycetaceae bacterium]
MPGGVPDADDTPGAMLALMNLRGTDEAFSPDEVSSLRAAAIWLHDLQNRDGGWPTFCRGWGTLPFDRSSCDLTAHALRALDLWLKRVPMTETALKMRSERSVRRGVRFLENAQSPNGTWLPLWFGHQFNEDDENPLYGTSRVVRALATIGEESSDCCQKAVHWLLNNQNDDGGWSARRGLESSVEETGLALDSLVGFTQAIPATDRGAHWLAARVNEGTVDRPTPIGFYFARLWYFEDLYPIIFAAAGLNRWRERAKK